MALYFIMGSSKNIGQIELFQCYDTLWSCETKNIKSYNKPQKYFTIFSICVNTCFEL